MKLMMSMMMLITMVSYLIVPTRLASAETITQSLYSTADAFIWSPSSTVVAAGTYADVASRNFGAMSSRHVAAATATGVSGKSQGAFDCVIRFDAASLASTLNATYGVGHWTIDSLSLYLMTSDNVAGPGIFNAPGTAGKFSVSYMPIDGGWTQGSGYLTPANYGSGNGATWNSIHSTLATSPATPLSTFDFVKQGVLKPATYADLGGDNLAGKSALTSALIAGNSVSLLLAAADDKVAFNFTSQSYGASSQMQYDPTLILTISTVPEPSMVLLGAAGAAILASRRKTE